MIRCQEGSNDHSRRSPFHRLLRPAGLALLTVVIAAPTAWAVASRVSVTVTDSVGQPVAGATISLGAVTATTDASGTAAVEVEEGEVALTVEHEDFATHEETVSVPAGGTSVSVRLDSKAATGGGGVVLGSSPGGSGLSVSAGWRSDTAETPKKGGSFTETVTDEGEVVFEGTTPEDVASENAELKSETSVDSTEVEVSFALRRSRGQGSELDMGLSPGASPAEAFFAALQGDGYGSAPRDDQVRFLPVLSLAVGEADLELEINGRQDPTIRNRFAESGTIYGAGLDLVWMLCDDCGWHLGVGYRYRTLRDLETNREPPRTFDGVVTIEDSATLDYESNQAHVFLGYGWSRVAVYGGARLNRREVKIEGRQVFDFSSFYGRSVVDTVDFDSRVGSEETEALLGLMFRFGDSPLYGRIEGSSDGDSESVHAGLTFAFGGR